MTKQPFIKKIIPTMAWIITDDDPRVRLKSSPLTFPLSSDDYDQIAKMISYVDASYDGLYEQYNIRPGVAIASNQINWQKRVVYLHFDDEFGNEKHWLLANPIIKSFSNEISYLDGGEGCLSVPNDHQGIVPRKLSIVVEAFDLFTNKPITIQESGYSAIVLQHEIDHLDGILYYDRINALNNNYADVSWKKI